MWKRDRMSKEQEKQQSEMKKMWIDDVHYQKFEKTEKLKKLFEIEAWQETEQLAYEQVTDLIQQQIETAFQDVTVKMKKADKETKSTV